MPRTVDAGWRRLIQDLLLVLRSALSRLLEPWPSGIDTLASEQFCLDCEDILGSPTLAKHVPDGRR